MRTINLNHESSWSELPKLNRKDTKIRVGVIPSDFEKVKTNATLNYSNIIGNSKKLISNIKKINVQFHCFTGKFNNKW